MRRGVNQKLIGAIGLWLGLISQPAQAQESPKLKRARATARMIDASIDRALRAAELEPAPQANTEQILRRLSLDLNGTIPNPALVTSTLRSRKPDKLSQVIEDMLASPMFSEHWSNVLANAWVGRKARRYSNYFRAYLAGELAKERPVDALVRDVLTAKGAVDENGATYFTLRWETSPTDVAAQSARVFMGLQIQCAQCHDHPFTEWKQEQFHAYAAYFRKIRRGNVRRGDNNVPTVMGNRGRDYRYTLKNTGREQMFGAEFLFELGDDDDDMETSASTGTDRAAVAALMTHPENPYFARMTVNRVWKSLFGRGLIEPAEDLEGQQGQHPRLLSLLSEELVESGFDLRQLVRAIVQSRAYQRSSRRAKGQRDPAAEYARVKNSKDDALRERAALAAQQDLALFARASLRSLSPEQVATSLMTATGLYRATERPDGAGPAMGMNDKFKKLRANLVRQFDQLYGEGDSPNPDAFDGTIPQSLLMLNGRFVNEAIKPQKGTLMAEIIRGSAPTKRVVSQLFMAVLSRRPTSAEARAFSRYLQAQGASVTTYEDLMWALINSSEFLMNH